MAELFRTNGVVISVTPKDHDGGLGWQEIRQLLGTKVYLVPLDDDLVMLMQATSSPILLPHNRTASTLFRQAIHARRAPANGIAHISGDVLVANYEELSLRQLISASDLVIF